MKPLENLPATPDIVGAAGRAWRYDIKAIAQASGNQPHASIVSWLIEARWAHPHWHSYDLTLVHLREVPALGAPKIYVIGATHEIILFALDPREPRNLKEQGSWLHPANFAAQLVEENDACAEARINDTVREICDGRLSPDTDHLQSWIMRFGSGMVKGDPHTAGETKIIISEPDKPAIQIVHQPAPPKSPLS